MTLLSAFKPLYHPAAMDVLLLGHSVNSGILPEHESLMHTL